MRETKRGTIEDRGVDSALGLRTKYADQRSHDVAWMTAAERNALPDSAECGLWIVGSPSAFPSVFPPNPSGYCKLPALHGGSCWTRRAL